MDIKDIEALAKELSNKFGVKDKCENDSCTYEEEINCCKQYGYIKIKEIIEKGINEGIRSDACTLPTEPTEKLKYMVQLNHDAYNKIDRISDVLLALDNYAAYKENKAPQILYITAEYLRTHIKDIRHILNEIYLLNKV